MMYPKPVDELRVADIVGSELYVPSLPEPMRHRKIATVVISQWVERLQQKVEFQKFGDDDFFFFFPSRLPEARSRSRCPPS